METNRPNLVTGEEELEMTGQGEQETRDGQKNRE